MTPHFVQRRRAARLKTRLKLQIDGIHSDFEEVDGDISVVGMFVELAGDVGELGSVQRLRLATLHGAERITLLARIARISNTTDFWKGAANTGIAFQFIFQETNELGSDAKTIPIERSWAIGEFVHCLAREAPDGNPTLDHSWPATLAAADGEPRNAMVHGISLQGTVLETEFQVPVGELIRVDIPGPKPEQRIALFGRAIESRAFEHNQGKGYRTAVSFEPTELPTSAEPNAGNSIADAFGRLLSAKSLQPPRPAERSQQLAGDLARISLVSVLTLCDLERATGVLHLRSALHEVRCYLRDGRLLDAERIGVREQQSPEAAVAPVLEWQAGTFELVFEPVSREDRVGRPIGAFLLHLMHAFDDSRRDPPGAAPE